LTAEGVVAAFDDDKGYGTVRDAATGAELFFHCTAIADGSRTIAIGTPVTFDVVPGRLGRWEASALSPASPAPGPDPAPSSP
jgi:cold shock CspA family protein